MQTVVTDLEILHQVSELVLPEEIEELKNTLFSFMEGPGLNKAVGISAIQLGIPKLAFAYRGSSGNLDEEELIRNNTLHFVVNPKKLDYKGELIASIEGCLSITNVKYVVKRYQDIHVEDKTGSYVLTEKDAIVWQHEFDHLNGILISDIGFIFPKNIGRNDMCPCKSNFKWKKCCGKYI